MEKSVVQCLNRDRWPSNISFQLSRREATIRRYVHYVYSIHSVFVIMAVILIFFFFLPAGFFKHSSNT